MRLCDILSVLAVSMSSCMIPTEDNGLSKIEWWKKSNYYHIYVRSFKDSDGDGNGDLRGIIEKLDYLQLIGVETLLTSPFYSSPMKDGGYDIDDYRMINPMFGSMKDFDDLVKELRKRKMHMVVDFVPNHSSDQHEWFKCSERAYLEPERCGKYKDYYVWSNSTRFIKNHYTGPDSTRLFSGYPTNWVSEFGGDTAWQWSDIRKEFYLHQFLPEQPDFNFYNQDVREEFKEIIRFWLRKGVDGFRVDASSFFFEDTIHWRDEEVNPNWDPSQHPAKRLIHTYTRSLPENMILLKEWRDIAKEEEFASREIVYIEEAFDDIPTLMMHYGTPSNRSVDMPFGFELLKIFKSNWNPDAIKDTAMSWIEPIRELGWPDENGAMAPWMCWVPSTHDNTRLSNRIGYQNVPFFKWLIYLLPGSPVNYYGDEMTVHDCDEDLIPESTRAEGGEQSRLGCRPLIPWTPEGPSAGFSSTDATWLPVNDDHKTRNVKTMLEDKTWNHLRLFIKLNRLRRKKLALFVFGDLVFYGVRKPKGRENMLFAMARTSLEHGNLLLLANMDSDRTNVVHLQRSKSVLRGVNYEAPKRGKIILVNYESSNTPQVKMRAKVDLDGLVLDRSQAIVVEF